MDSLDDEKATGEEEELYSQGTTSSQRKKQRKQRKKRVLGAAAEKVASRKKSKVVETDSTGAGVRQRPSTRQTDIRLHTRLTDKGKDGKSSKDVTSTHEATLRSGPRDDG
jgi:hypothetical protein